MVREDRPGRVHQSDHGDHPGQDEAGARGVPRLPFARLGLPVYMRATQIRKASSNLRFCVFCGPLQLYDISSFIVQNMWIKMRIRHELPRTPSNPLRGWHERPQTPPEGTKYAVSSRKSAPTPPSKNGKYLKRRRCDERKATTSSSLT